MNRKLVLLTEIIAPYRIPVFNALAHEPGIDLHVIFFSENDPALRQWLIYKDEIHFSYEVLNSRRLRLGRLNLLLNRGLAAAVRKAAPDAIICGGYNYAASWHAQSWARRNRVPFLIWVESTIQDLRQGGPLIEALKTCFLRRCSAYVAAGKSSSEYLLEFGIQPRLIFTAPNAVDNDFFATQAAAVRSRAHDERQALGLPERFFLFVGRLIRAKGVFDLLNAYASLPPETRERVGLVLCGDGEVRGELQTQAAKIAPGRIVFPGFVQREKLAAYHALAETLVLPTHSDTWGLVVNEAMACGLPIIVTGVAGCAADLVEDGWNGRVVAAHDVRQLASALSLLAADPPLRVRMGDHSRERIALYSPERCASGMAQSVRAVWGVHEG